MSRDIPESDWRAFKELRALALERFCQRVLSHIEVGALASELRRVKGASSTRGYLRRVIDTLERFPTRLVEEQLLELSRDPEVGPRFRQRLRSLALRYDYE